MSSLSDSSYVTHVSSVTVILLILHDVSFLCLIRQSLMTLRVFMSSLTFIHTCTCTAHGDFYCDVISLLRFPFPKMHASRSTQSVRQNSTAVNRGSIAIAI